MKFNTDFQDPKKMNSNDVDDSTCYFTGFVKYLKIYCAHFADAHGSRMMHWCTVGSALSFTVAPR